MVLKCFSLRVLASGELRFNDFVAVHVGDSIELTEVMLQNLWIRLTGQGCVGWTLTVGSVSIF